MKWVGAAWRAAYCFFDGGIKSTMWCAGVWSKCEIKLIQIKKEETLIGSFYSVVCNVRFGACLPARLPCIRPLNAYILLLLLLQRLSVWKYYFRFNYRVIQKMKKKYYVYRMMYSMGRHHLFKIHSIFSYHLFLCSSFYQYLSKKFNENISQ